MERIRTNKLNTPDNCNLFIHLSPLNFVIFMLLHREGERGKGERDHEQMEDAHKEDSFRALMVSIAGLTNSLATIAATVLASNPGWLLPAVSI